MLKKVFNDSERKIFIKKSRSRLKLRRFCKLKRKFIDDWIHDTFIFFRQTLDKEKKQWNLQINYKYLQFCEKNNRHPKYTQYNIWWVKQISVQDSLSQLWITQNETSGNKTNVHSSFISSTKNFMIHNSPSNLPGTSNNPITMFMENRIPFYCTSVCNHKLNSVISITYH